MHRAQEGAFLAQERAMILTENGVLEGKEGACHVRDVPLAQIMANMAQARQRNASLSQRRACVSDTGASDTESDSVTPSRASLGQRGHLIRH